MTYYKKMSSIIQSSNKHGLISSSISKLITNISLIIDKNSLTSEININTTTRIIFDKLLNLIKLTNIYLYKSNSYEYVNECNKCSNMFKELNDLLNSIQVYGVEKKINKHSVMMSIEKIICSGYQKLQSIIDFCHLNRKKMLKNDSVNKSKDNNIDLILDYFDNKFEEDKSFIYDFIDNNTN